MATDLDWRDAAGSTLSTLTFTNVLPGTPTAAQVAILWNDYGGSTADTAYRIRIYVESRETGSGDPFTKSGIPILDNRAVQMQVVQGENITAPVPATGYKSIGAGAWIEDLPDLGQDEGIRFNVRVSMPAGAAVQSWDLRFFVANDKFTPLEAGHFEADRAGILHRVGDGEASYFVNSPTVTANSPADDKYDIGDVLCVHEGIPVVVLGEEITAAAAAAGKERYDLVSYSATSGRTVTAGSEVTAPVTDDDIPDPPADDLPLAYIAVDETPLIDTAEITVIGSSDVYALSDSGTTATMTGGQALVANRRLRESEPQSATMNPSVTETYWLNSDGTVEIATAANRSELRAMAQHSLTTDGSSLLTSSTDLRTYLDAASYPVNATAYNPSAAGRIWAGFNPYRQSLWFFPGDRVLFALHVTAASDDPSTLGFTGGAWTIGMKLGTPGGLVTMFTTGPETRAPTLAYNATTHTDAAALPELLEWAAGEMLEISLVAVPTGPGTLPLGLTVSMPWRYPVG